MPQGPHRSRKAPAQSWRSWSAGTSVRRRPRVHNTTLLRCWGARLTARTKSSNMARPATAQ
eukprot:2647320-Pyramimonas_sp.AAC.1